MSREVITPTLGGVSVAIPTKNRARLLEQTLRSVREQTVPAAEVIVADDGSTDDTERVASAFGARHLLNAAGDWGPAGARNAAIEAARTPFVAFMDSDDLYRPGALESLQRELVSSPGAPFAFGRALAAHLGRDGWESDGVIGPRRWELDDYLCWLYARNTVPTSGVLVRRDAALRAGGFDRRLVFAQDHDLWLRLARGGTPAHVPRVLCVHRRHPGNRMSPAVAARYYRLITELADEEERFRRCLPRRLGVQMSEIALDALHRRSPRALGMAAAQLVRGRRRGEMLRSAAIHLRERRRSAREGAALLATDTELRDWLAGYR